MTENKMITGIPPKRSTITVDELLQAVANFLNSKELITSPIFSIDEVDKFFGVTKVVIEAASIRGRLIDTSLEEVYFDLPKVIKSKNSKLGNDIIPIQIYVRPIGSISGIRSSTIEAGLAARRGERLLNLIVEPLSKRRIAVQMAVRNPDGTLSYVPTNF